MGETAICPLCGVATALYPVLITDKRAILPESSSDRQNVFGKAIVSAITDDEYPHFTSHGVYECQACGQRFVAKKHRYDDKDWIVVYPIPRKLISQEVPEPIKSEYEEASLCFAVGAYRACASTLQITLESIWRDKGVSRLTDLRDKGVISQSLYDRANEIRLWGNVVKHEVIGIPVTKEDAEQLLDCLDRILNAVYIEPKRFERLKEKREQLEKKKDS